MCICLAVPCLIFLWVCSCGLGGTERGLAGWLSPHSPVSPKMTYRENGEAFTHPETSRVPTLLDNSERRQATWSTPQEFAKSGRTVHPMVLGVHGRKPSKKSSFFKRTELLRKTTISSDFLLAIKLLPWTHVPEENSQIGPNDSMSLFSAAEICLCQWQAINTEPLGNNVYNSST